MDPMSSCHTGWKAGGRREGVNVVSSAGSDEYSSVAAEKERKKGSERVNREEKADNKEDRELCQQRVMCFLPQVRALGWCDGDLLGWLVQRLSVETDSGCPHASSD